MARADLTDSSKICGIEPERCSNIHLYEHASAGLCRPILNEFRRARVQRIDSHAVNPTEARRVSDSSQQKEDVMSRMSCTRWLAANAATMLLFAGHACASQGPGTTPGTASAFTQMAMAVIVYGLCAGAIVIGAITALRKS